MCSASIGCYYPLQVQVAVESEASGFGFKHFRNLKLWSLFDGGHTPRSTAKPDVVSPIAANGSEEAVGSLGSGEKEHSAEQAQTRKPPLPPRRFKVKTRDWAEEPVT